MARTRKYGQTDSPTQNSHCGDYVELTAGMLDKKCQSSINIRNSTIEKEHNIFAEQ